MTPCGESRKNMEATRLSTLLLIKHINMGTWNVRAMYQTGKTAQVAGEITKYKLSLLGISETRWTQTGQRRIDTEELLLFPGHEEEDAPHTERVVFMLSRVGQMALLGWEAHGP